MKVTLIRSYCDICWNKNNKEEAIKSFAIHEKGIIDLCRLHLPIIEKEDILKQEDCKPHVIKIEAKNYDSLP